jgi:hypothetical protein
LGSGRLDCVLEGSELILIDGIEGADTEIEGVSGRFTVGMEGPESGKFMIGILGVESGRLIIGTEGVEDGRFIVVNVVTAGASTLIEGASGTRMVGTGVATTFGSDRVDRLCL